MVVLSLTLTGNIIHNMTDDKRPLLKKAPEHLSIFILEQTTSWMKLQKIIIVF